MSAFNPSGSAFAAPSLRRRLLGLLLRHASLVLFLGVFAVFGCLAPGFLELRNLANILQQSSAIAIVAIGMTFVLLTAGVDLSVGSVMFVAVAVAGKLIYNESAVVPAFAAALAVGALAGAINALLITRVQVAAFIVTLAMLFVWRGFGLWYTHTRAMNMPEEVTSLGASRILGVPGPVLLLGVVAVGAHLTLTRTPFGRQVLAVGRDAPAARKAGVRVGRILFTAYVLCGLCAALGGLVALTQTGAVSPTFGQQREFAAIAAAVLGGTSLFGGRGSVLPGTVFGAVLIQTIENGLVIRNVDPYLHPLITSVLIFLAVLVDCLKARGSLQCAAS